MTAQEIRAVLAQEEHAETEVAMSRFGTPCGGCGGMHLGGWPTAARGSCPDGHAFRSPEEVEAGQRALAEAYRHPKPAAAPDARDATIAEQAKRIAALEQALRYVYSEVEHDDENPGLRAVIDIALAGGEG